MESNLLRAILNISSFRNNDLKSYSSTYLIRINAVGEQLEYYVKDALASSFEFPHNKKKERYSEVFSWSGNQNNPPDFIVKGGDAFEVKKLESLGGSLALNSSPPKNMLRSTDIRITGDCRQCDGGKWKEKDIFYTIGSAKKGKMRYLFFVHGRCYAANHSVYDKIHEPIKKEVGSAIENLGFETNNTVELGKVKRVDPLGITELRIRGMWSIQNPLRVFEDHCGLGNNKFQLFALLTKEKYLSYPPEDIKALEAKKDISIEDIEVCDPNNPAKMLKSKLITFSI
jgi:hypothetical protein